MATGVARNLQRAFRAYRRWTDRALLFEGDGRTRAMAAMLPTAIIVLLASTLGVTHDQWVAFAVLGTVWLVWQGWTLSRIRHAFLLADWVKGKLYEREGRYNLPPEYRDTENATLAARRRRRKNGR